MKDSPKQYSQYKAMMAISAASLRSMLRSPSAVIFTIAFPLIFIVVFGFIGSNRIRLEVGLHPDSNRELVAFTEFSKLNHVHVVDQISLKEMEDLLQKGRLDAILHIYKEENGGEMIAVMTSKAAKEKGTFVITLLKNQADQRNIGLLKSTQNEKSLSSLPLTAIEESVIEGREYKMIDFILPGQLGFSILSAGVFGTAFVFFSLRQTLVLKRFFATPVSRSRIVLGEAISRLVFQMGGAALILILGKYVFGFTLIHGIWTALQMMLLAALGLIVFMGFGFVVSGIAKSESVIPPIANIVTLPQFLLSGTFFPVDAFPDWLQAISKVLPLTYLNDALRKIAFEGAGFMQISTELGVIALWGLIIYIAAVRFFRWE